MAKKGRARRRNAAAEAKAADSPTTSAASADAPPGAADARGVSRRYLIALVVVMAVFVVVLSLLSIQKHRGFQGGRYDTGIMTQTVYNTAHGRFLESTTAEGKQQNRLGSHVDPIIAAFALPWLVWPSPDMLFVGQALIVALAAWPAFRLGRRALGDERAAFLLATALLLYPPLQFAVLNEFHPVTLAIPLLLFAFTYLEEDRRWTALPFLVLAALCKEEVPLVIACMGAYFALRKRAWWPLAITALATAYFLVAVGVVIPHYSTHSSGGTPFLERYSAYGDDPGDVARNVFLKPDQTAADLFSASDLSYWFKLLWPFAFTSLLSPLTLLIAAPEFLLNALAGRGFQRMITFHYVAAEVPFLFASAVLGLARLRRWLERRAGAAGEARGARRHRDSAPPRAAHLARRLPVGTLAGVVLGASVAANFFMGPLPFSLPGAAYSGAQYRLSAHVQVLNEAIAMIPDGDSVVVTTANNAGAVLSERHVVYSWPYIDEADWVIVDQTRPFVLDEEDRALHDEALGQLLVSNADYQNVYSRDGVLVFKRIAGEPAADESPKAPGASPSPGASP